MDQNHLMVGEMLPELPSCVPKSMFRGRTNTLSRPMSQSDFRSWTRTLKLVCLFQWTTAFASTPVHHANWEEDCLRCYWDRLHIIDYKLAPQRGCPSRSQTRLHGHLSQHSHHNQTKMYQPCNQPDLTHEACHIWMPGPVPQNAY